DHRVGGKEGHRALLVGAVEVVPGGGDALVPLAVPAGPRGDQRRAREVSAERARRMAVVAPRHGGGAPDRRHHRQPAGVAAHGAPYGGEAYPAVKQWTAYPGVRRPWHRACAGSGRWG